MEEELFFIHHIIYAPYQRIPSCIVLNESFFINVWNHYILWIYRQYTTERSIKPLEQMHSSQGPPKLSGKLSPSRRRTPLCWQSSQDGQHWPWAGCWQVTAGHGFSWQSTLPDWQIQVRHLVESKYHLKDKGCFSSVFFSQSHFTQMKIVLIFTFAKKDPYKKKGFYNICW